MNPTIATPAITETAVPPDAANRWRLGLGFFASYVTLIVLVVYLGPALLSPRVYNCDTRVHVAWMAVYQDADLFPNDWAKHHYFDVFYSHAFCGIFAATAPWCDAQSTAEWLGVVLSLASAWLAYRIGRALLPNEPLAGLAALGWFLVAGTVHYDLHFIRWVQGGMQRAFLVPCFFLGLLGFVTRRPGLVAGASVLGALYYPPMSIVMGAIWLVFLLCRWWQERKLPGDWPWFLGGNGVAIAILLATQPQSWLDYSLTEALSTPDFFDPELVAYEMQLHHTLWPYLAALLPFPVWLNGALVVLLIGLAWRRLDLPWSIILAIVVGSWASYALALVLYNRLYEPMRYLFPVRCLWLLLAPFVAAEVMGGLKAVVRWRPSVSVARASLAGALLAATIGAGALCHSRYQRGEGGVSGPLPDAAYEYVAALPKDVLIAGYPLDIGDIPLLSRRRVLLLGEAFFPCHREFYEEAKDRFACVQRALNAPDFGPAIELLDRYGAQYLIVMDHATADWDIYRATATFASLYREIDAASGGRTPAVQNPPPETIVFAQDGCTIIDLTKLKTLNVRPGRN